LQVATPFTLHNVLIGKEKDYNTSHERKKNIEPFIRKGQVKLNFANERQLLIGRI
jgi:hypothetical protein